MNPPNFDRTIMDRLMRAYEEASRAAGVMANLTTQIEGRLTGIEHDHQHIATVLTKLADQAESMSRDRDRIVSVAVTDIKDHVSSAVEDGLRTSELWWRRAFWIGVILVSLSNVLGVGLEKLFGLLK
jgi:hypothetical protein